MIRKAYVDTAVAGGVMQTHYRTDGQGEPLVMLHPSPMSSAFLVPVIERAVPHFKVFALDTPGYGASDPLPKPPEGIEGYVDWLAAALGGLGLGPVTLYGSATGAQVAIEFAKAHPDRVRALVLENAVHFTDAETDEIMARYFPDISPVADGSHLDTAWSMADGLFRGFPWYEHAGQSGGAEPPVGLVHATVMAYLQAGPDYARAYRAAFRNERAERLAAVPVPTRVIRWSGGLLNDYAIRFDDRNWPAHIRMEHCGPDVDGRFAALERVFSELAG